MLLIPRFVRRRVALLVDVLAMRRCPGPHYVRLDGPRHHELRWLLQRQHARLDALERRVAELEARR